MGCWPKVNFFKRLNHKKKYLIWNALQEVNLLNKSNHYIDSLSEGQIQRMLFARILVQQSSLILLDEPLQGIDQVTCNILLNSINKLRQNGCTIITVLHNDTLVSKHFSKILSLNPLSSTWKQYSKINA